MTDPIVLMVGSILSALTILIIYILVSKDAKWREHQAILYESQAVKNFRELDSLCDIMAKILAKIDLLIGREQYQKITQLVAAHPKAETIMWKANYYKLHGDEL